MLRPDPKSHGCDGHCVYMLCLKQGAEPFKLQSHVTAVVNFEPPSPPPPPPSPPPPSPPPLPPPPPSSPNIFVVTGELVSYASGQVGRYLRWEHALITSLGFLSFVYLAALLLIALWRLLGRPRLPRLPWRRLTRCCRPAREAGFHPLNDEEEAVLAAKSASKDARGIISYRISASSRTLAFERTPQKPSPSSPIKNMRSDLAEERLIKQRAESSISISPPRVTPSSVSPPRATGSSPGVFYRSDYPKQTTFVPADCAIM